MLKLSNRGLMIIAVSLSLVTTGLVYSYLKKAGGSHQADTVSVVVAKVDIGAKTRITPEMVQEIKVPALYLQPGAVSVSKEAVGGLPREPIVAGEQITARRLISEGKSAGFTGMIPPDKRAVTVGVNEITGVAGFVKAGDYVDVIVTFGQNVAGDNVSHLVLQNILVLASDRETGDAAAETANSSQPNNKKDIIKNASVTLAVAPEEAARLALSEDTGKIRLALRPFLQDAGISIAPPVTSRDIVGNHTPPVTNEGPKEQVPPQIKQPAGGIQMIRGTKTELVPIN